MTRKEDDTISREAALNLMRSLTRWSVMSEDGKFSNVGLLYDDVMIGIDRLPSANTTKTGHWIRWYEVIDNGDGCTNHIPHCRCSECNKEYDSHISQFINYCSKCGAKMENTE